MLAAPPHEVWPAVSEPDRLASWFGGRVELDARPGGRVVLSDEDGERWGTVEFLEPGRRLVLRLWTRASALVGTRVEFSLEDEGGRTRLTVAESPIERSGGWATARPTAGVGRG